jgi:hypothetical protein
MKHTLEDCPMWRYRSPFDAGKVEKLHQKEIAEQKRAERERKREVKRKREEEEAEARKRRKKKSVPAKSIGFEEFCRQKGIAFGEDAGPIAFHEKVDVTRDYIQHRKTATATASTIYVLSDEEEELAPPTPEQCFCRVPWVRRITANGPRAGKSYRVCASGGCGFFKWDRKELDPRVSQLQALEKQAQDLRDALSEEAAPSSL